MLQEYAWQPPTVPLPFVPYGEMPQRDKVTQPPVGDPQGQRRVFYLGGDEDEPLPIIYGEWDSSWNADNKDLDVNSGGITTRGYDPYQQERFRDQLDTDRERNEEQVRILKESHDK